MSFRRSKIPKFIPILSLLILLVLGPIVFSFLQNAGKVEAAWVDDNFSYRNAIPITSHTAAETNVYISATIDTSASGQFQSDCGDLRFTTVGGDILPYYIVSGCVSASTVVHVFFKSMPAGAQTLYYYYGNPSAANGFSSADFSTVASSYALGSIASQEKGGAPIAYWKFDDGTGTNTQDSSPNNNDGTITGATWQSEDQCISGKCLFFDGTNDDVVTISDNNMLDFGTDSFTVSGWALHNDYTYPKSNFMIKKSPTCYGSGAANAGFDIGHGYYASGINICLHDNLDNRVYTNVTFDSGYRPSELINKWTYYVFVFNRTTGKVYTFINGVKQSSELDISSVTGSINNSSSLSIGTLYGWRTHGKIDDVRIYNYARTAAQIKSDFKSRGTAKGSSASLGSKISDLGSLSNGLVGYWKMDESAANSCTGGVNDSCDSSGNGRDGAFQTSMTNSNIVSGKYGNAVYFDGTDDHTDLGTPLLTTTDANQPYSGFAWIKTTDADGGIITQYSGSGDRWGFRAQSTLRYWKGGSDLATSTTTINDGNWHHVGFVKTSTQQIFLYIDGKQDGSGTDSLDFENVNTVIGKFGTGSVVPYIGTIDEVRIYNRALSPREVRDLYAFAPGPVGYWNMDEKTGGNAYDKSGNGNTGTITAATWSTGKFGGGLQFNGSTTWVETALSPAVPASRNYTQSLWFYPTSATDGILIDDYNRWEHYIQMNSNRTVKACYYDVSTVCATSTNTITLNTWSHIAAVIDSGNSISVYVNGTLWAQNTSLGGVQSRILNDVVIGAGGNTHPTPFTGTIDDVRIYNYARTQKQIVEDMNAGHPVGGSPVGSQRLYWKLDEGYGSPNDSGPNNIVGTLAGATLPAWKNEGKFGKSLFFTATTDSNPSRVSASPVNLSTTTGDALTLSLWLKPNATQTNSSAWLIRNGTGYDENYGFNLNSLSSGLFKVSMEYYDGTAFRTITSTSTFVPTAVWSQLTLVITQGTNLKLYLNGKLRETLTWSNGNSVSSSTSFNLGGHNGTTTQSYDGYIDEVKIYNSALTSDEIQIDYNRGQALVLGNTGEASSSAGAIYCQPGSSDTCSPPVAEWNFEERSGQTVNDISGNGYSGTLGANSSVASDDPTWTDGILGKALRYDGGDDYTDLGNPTGLNIGTGAFTIEAWVNNTMTIANNTFMDWVSKGGYSDGLELRFVVGGDGTRYIDGWIGGSAIGGAYNFQTNTWYHVALTRDGSGNWIEYINGVKKFNGSTSNTLGTDNWRIGRGKVGREFYWKGMIDDVRIFNYARTPAQVAWDYNQGKPIAQWKMDECQGGSVFDASGNGNTGTITIGATGTQTAVGTCTTSGTAWYNGVTGKFNSSLNFDGTDDYVSMGNTQDMATNTFAVSAWIKTSTNFSGGNVVIAGKANSGNGQQYSLQFRTTNKTGFIVANGSASNVAVSNNTLNDGGWHHIVGMQNGNATSIYVDGVLNSTDSTNTVTTTSNSNNFNVARRYSGDMYYTGQIDDVRIYNYALTPLQIRLLFNGSSAVRFGPLTGSP